jgi:hypothetical protein
VTQLYEAIVSRTTYYRVIVEPHNDKPLAAAVLQQMEIDSEDVEQYRIQGFAYVEGDPYGADTAVTAPDWKSVAMPNGWAIALPSDSNETADIQANIVV